MKIIKNEKFILFFLIPLAGFILDFITKQIVIIELCMQNKVANVTPFFNFVCVVNRGVSFGLFSNIQNATVILLIITIIILVFIHFLLYKEKNIFAKYGYSLIISGAYGNIIDRFFHRGVVDFLDFFIKNWHYPAFNVADSLIFTGVCLIIFLGKKTA